MEIKNLLWMILIFFAKGDIWAGECEAGELCVPLKNMLFPKLPSKYLDVQVIDPLSKSKCKLFLESSKTMMVIGSDCKAVPGNRSLHYSSMTVTSTGIEMLKPEAFGSWNHMEDLVISNNMNLWQIKPKTFLGLTDLKKLSISDNRNLRMLCPMTFQGLDRLEEVVLTGNGFVSVCDATRALSPCVLPSLLSLDLSHNYFRIIGPYEFLSLKKSKLKSLTVRKAGIDYISSTALCPLNQLEELDLGLNNIDSSDAADLIYQITLTAPLFKKTQFETNLLSSNTKLFLTAVSTSNITHLDISKNDFEKLEPGFFPFMPHLEVLGMEYSMIKNIPEGIFNETTMPNLKHLLLGGNDLNGISPSFTLSSLLELDVSRDLDHFLWTSEFIIPQGIFNRMPNLQTLNLSGNKLSLLRNNTLGNLNNLQILFLKNTNLKDIEENSFKENNKLFFLDLSYNNFPKYKALRKDIFTGLEGLMALSLAHCSISNIEQNDVFALLKGLKYLSLRGNSLVKLDHKVLEPLEGLTELDLRENQLVAWETRMFPSRQPRSLLLDKNHLSTVSPAMLLDFANISSVTIGRNNMTCGCSIVEILNASYSAAARASNCSYCLVSRLIGQICVQPLMTQTVAQTTQLINSQCDLIHRHVKLSLLYVVAPSVMIIGLFIVFIYILHRRKKLTLSDM